LRPCTNWCPRDAVTPSALCMQLDIMWRPHRITTWPRCNCCPYRMQVQKLPTHSRQSLCEMHNIWAGDRRGVLGGQGVGRGGGGVGAKGRTGNANG
jgi:hypothetical protein